MKTSETRVRITTKAMRLLSLAASCLLAHGACAAQFQPTGGGDLDNPSNWNNTTDTSFAVIKQQSASLTLSASEATLPNNGNLIYRTNVHTNDFGAGKTLTVPLVLVEQNATLVHRSGKIKATSTGASINQQARMANGNAFFTGADAILEVDGTLNVGTSAATGSLAVENGATVNAGTLAVAADSTLSAKDSGTSINAETYSLNGGTVAVGYGAMMKMTGSLTADGGSVVIVDNAKLLHDTTTDRRLTFNTGSFLSMKNSIIEFAGNKGKLYLDGGMALFDGVTVAPEQSNTVLIGGDGGTLTFSGSPSAITHRFSMVGDDFTFCVSNATVNFSPSSASELFITGSGSASESSEDGHNRIFRFCGAAPRLAIGSTGGFHLRGTSITLQFDIGAEGFPTDAAVVEITNGGSFKGDAGTCGASRIIVNVDDRCPAGTYTLLKGDKAATFLTGENKWQTNSDMAVISAPDNNTVVVTVKKRSGMLIVFK